MRQGEGRRGEVYTMSTVKTSKNRLQLLAPPPEYAVALDSRCATAACWDSQPPVLGQRGPRGTQRLSPTLCPYNVLGVGIMWDSIILFPFLNLHFLEC